MVTIEVFVYVFIASMMVVCVNYMNKVGFGKKSDFIYFWVMFSLIITQMFIQISPQIRNSIHYITSICLGTLFTLTLIYFIIRITVSSIETQEDARVWIGETMSLVLVTSVCALLMAVPDTKWDLLRIPLALALCIGMKYYPPVLDQLIRLRTDTEESMEGNKEAIINLATESWRFTTVYQRMLTNLDTSEQRKYASQLRWFVKKLEESLEEDSLRIVNVEGHPYDPGMAATPVNIEDFDADEPLVVNRMLEPIIMEGKVLVKTGKVTLRRIE